MPKKNEENHSLPQLELRAEIMPESFDEENRIVRVQYTTGARVLRSRLFEDSFYEELSTEKGHVRLERLKSGAPVLDSHMSYNLRSQMGVVIDADETHATLKFSERETIEPFFQDIKAGILRNVSVGYVVHKFEDVTESDEDIRVLRAVDWEPYEISMVAIGADAGAGVRSGVTHDCTIVGRKAETSENLKKGTEMPDEVKEEIRAEDKNQQRGENVDSSTVAVDVKNAEQVREDAVKSERTRVSEIQDTVRKAGLEQSVADDLIERGVSIDEARKQIIDQWCDQDKTETRSAVVVGEDLSRKARIEGAENALAHRANPAIELTETGCQWRGMTLMEMSRDLLTEGGVNVRGLSRSEIAVRALSTSDFSEILSNVANRTLRDAYGNVTRTFTPWARQTSLPDFKEISRTALSEAPSLEKVVEGGEYKYGEFGEGAEKYRLFTYGKIISITRETIINDDLDAFTRAPARMGAAASRLESDLVYGALTGNTKMSDNKALFHADHKNLFNDLLTVDGVAALEAAMASQTGLGGKDALNLSPAFILGGPKQKLAMQRTLGVIEPNKADDVNPFENSMQMIVEQRLGDTDYYLAADPSQIDTIEYSYLEGESGPYIESRQGFNRDGVEIKVRHDFASKAIDFRGLAKSTNDAT